MRALPLLVLLAALAGPVSTAQPVQSGEVLDGIAAVVGDLVVLRSEVDALAQSASQGQPVDDALWSRALDQLVNQRVLVVKAKRDTTIDIPDDYVTEQLDARVDALAGQVGGEAQLEALYGRRVSEIKASLRGDVRDELFAQQYRSRRLQEVTITPGEVRAWFERIPVAERPEVPEQVRVAHVVKVPEPNAAARQQARDFAQALRDSITAEQATFEEIADRNTVDPGNVNRDGTTNGGRYDRFTLRDLVPNFSAAAAALQPGQISQVFETEFGYHVLRLNSRDGDRISFNHVLIPISEEGSETGVARDELTVLRDSVVTHGVPFEAIARRHSEDPFSAYRGGFVADPRTQERDLRLDALGQQWKANVDTLEVGEISEPTEVTLLDAEGTKALHFVLLQKRTPAHPLSPEIDYAILSDYALQDKRQQVFADWVERLRRDVYVDVRSERYAPPPTS